MSGAGLATAAEALVGVPFRLHGRDPVAGLDCIGLLASALAAIGRPALLPNGYALRNRDIARWLPDAASCGFAPANGPVEPGDVVVARIGASQFHLAIAARGSGWVHAHAGLRRVVHQPGALPGAPIVQWRLIPT